MLDLIQGSPEWLAARAGSLGASQIGDALARTKSGWGASRANVAARLVTERLTGRPMESFTNAAMQRGHDLEPLAREAYSEAALQLVTEIGLVKHPAIAWTHCSPDGLCGEDGLVEIKCVNAARHIELLTGSPPEDRYVKQCLWQMACTGRAWCDLAYYNPDLPQEMHLYTTRIERDTAAIEEMETEVSKFLAEVDETVADLRERYMMKEAA